MLLAIDIGNTNIAFGVFEGETLRATWNIATDLNKTADEYAVLLLNLLPRDGLALSDIDHAVICSVVPPLDAIFDELIKRYLRTSPLVISPGVKTGVRIGIDNPREVGADRVVNAAAAHRLYGGPIIIIDFGTATTLDAISEDGEYLGGAIAPGIGIAAEALFTRASKLPRIELVPPGTCNWPKYGNGNAIRSNVRLCGTGRKSGSSYSSRIRRQSKSCGHRWSCQHYL